MTAVPHPARHLILETTVVGMDEPALQLVELDLQSPGNRGWHRYQTIIVLRGDQWYRFRRDLGPSRKWQQIPPTRVLGGGTDPDTGRYWSVHTVGELIDISHAYWAGKITQPEVAPSDLIGGYHDSYDQRRRRARRLSQFGPLAKTQRDG